MRVLVLLLCSTLLGACSCQRQPEVDASVAAAADHSAGVAAAAISAGTAADLARAARTDQQRARAMSEAVDTLHAYLGELGSGQRDAAEKRWAYQRSPSVSEEAGLRSLDNLQALRIENGTPKPLDAEAVPAYLEIPVQLRASLDGGQTHRYHGWYRLRHNPVTMRWELTAASVAAVIR